MFFLWKGVSHLTLLDYKIIDLEFNFSKRNWSNKVEYRTKFEVETSKNDSDNILLVVTQKIFNDKQDKPVFKIKLIGAFKRENEEESASNYNEQFNYLYDILIEKVEQIKEISNIQMPPTPTLEELKTGLQVSG